jgi:ornithine carbamoyltransferase
MTPQTLISPLQQPAAIRQAFPALSAMARQDFLTLADVGPETLTALLDLADAFKAARKNGQPHPLLAGQHVAMYFEKPSNRTRLSFEVGIVDLGAHPAVLRKEEINLGVRESIEDTARTLSRYVHAIMIRTFAQQDVEALAAAATVPVINGLTDAHHPCQVVADLQTIREQFGTLAGRKLVFIGDGNNMAHSLLEGGALTGMHVTIACPKGYEPDATLLAQAQRLAQASGAQLAVMDDVQAAVQGAHVLYTDVWASMGQEAEAEKRRRDFAGFQINAQRLAEAHPDAVVLHCLPAHRGEEITHEALERHAAVVFNQAENRLHAQKAILTGLLLQP